MIKTFNNFCKVFKESFDFNDTSNYYYNIDNSYYQSDLKPIQENDKTAILKILNDNRIIYEIATVSSIASNIEYDKIKIKSFNVSYDIYYLGDEFFYIQDSHHEIRKWKCDQLEGLIMWIENYFRHAFKINKVD